MRLRRPRPSLTWWRLPKLDLVALRIDDPAKLAVLRIIGLLQDVAALFTKCLKERDEVLHSVVDHERRLAGRKVVAVCRADGPDRCPLQWVAIDVRPGKCCPTPFLNIDAQVCLVPSAQLRGILGVKENP